MYEALLHIAFGNVHIAVWRIGNDLYTQFVVGDTLVHAIDVEEQFGIDLSEVAYRKATMGEVQKLIHMAMQDMALTN